jgi:hypothetical protein
LRCRFMLRPVFERVQNSRSRQLKLLSRKLFANVNSLFANESDGYKTTSATSVFRSSCGRSARIEGKSRLPSKVNAITETAIKKIYLTAEQEPRRQAPRDPPESGARHPESSPTFVMATPAGSRRMEKKSSSVASFRPPTSVFARSRSRGHSGSTSRRAQSGSHGSRRRKASRRSRRLNLFSDLQRHVEAGSD